MGDEMEYEGEPNLGELMVLRYSAARIRELEKRLDMERRERNVRALRLVVDGHTWRDVAAAAGLANPYTALPVLVWRWWKKRREQKREARDA